ncbi:hypothetical protein KR059_011655, partial [Drosophila kikkawai]
MQDAEFAKGLEHFTFRLHDQLTRANPDRNVVYSPLSIRTSGGMLRMAAVENSPTAAELDAGLRFSPGDVQSIAQSFDVVLRAYEQCGILKLANRLYVMMGLSPGKKFGSMLENNFHSKPIEIDFGSDQAAKTINSWVESQTNELIKDIIGPGVLSSRTRLVLVNAIHFKGEWVNKFAEEETKKEKFFLESKQSADVTMMHTRKNFFIGELPNLKATALRLDYSACNLAMIILLPDENSSLPNLEKLLAGTTLEAISSSMALELVDVKIPKFRADFQQELSDTFKLMSMGRIFSDQAELGEMLASRELISVSHIIHKAFIEVNEVGTEAAAATAVAIAFRSAHLPKALVFHANRPFFYAIYDKVHGFLFAGRFCTPPSERASNCKCD